MNLSPETEDRGERLSGHTSMLSNTQIESEAVILKRLEIELELSRLHAQTQLKEYEKATQLKEKQLEVNSQAQLREKELETQSQTQPREKD